MSQGMHRPAVSMGYNDRFPTLATLLQTGGAPMANGPAAARQPTAQPMTQEAPAANPAPVFGDGMRRPASPLASQSQPNASWGRQGPMGMGRMLQATAAVPNQPPSWAGASWRGQ